MNTDWVRPNWSGLLSGCAVLIVACSTGSLAQQTVAQPAETMISLQQVIAANAATPQQICPAITPLLRANPSAATAVIENAQAQPDLLEPLCECLSSAQRILSQSDPQGAEVVAKAVAAASPAFQACYAVAQAPGDGGGQQAAAPGPQGGTGGGGGGGGAPFSPSGLGGIGGFGGGPVSPN